MAERATRFAAEWIMSSPDPRKHMCFFWGVHNFDCALWGCVQEDAVLACTFAKFTQNPAI